MIHLPVIKDLPFLTLGQIILALPLLAILLGGYYVTFAAPSVDASGDYAGYALLAVFLTANKSNSIAAFLFGIPFERMIPFHNLSSLITVVVTGFHIYVAYTLGGGGDSGDSEILTEDNSMFLGSSGGNFSSEGGSDDSSDSNDRRLSSEDSQFGANGASPNLLRFLFADSEDNSTGSMLTCAILLLVLQSIFPIFRRKFFDLWFWTHILLAITAIIFCYLHSVTVITWAAIWWAVDAMMRYVVMAGCRYSRKAKITLVSDDTVEISFDKGNFEYKPGQFVQFSIPSINPLAFHPISISSAPQEPVVTLHVRALGKWSSKLVKLAQTGTQEVSILVEGPYGSVGVDMDDDVRYQTMLFVCGGIGVTHCQSVAKAVIHDCKRGRQPTDIRFVWALREPEMLKAFGSLTDVANPAEVEDSATLGTSDEGNVVHDVYFTKKSFGDDVKQRIEAEDSRNFHYGRPAISSIVSEIKEKAVLNKQKHVAVFVCGPSSLVDLTKNACRVLSSGLLAGDGVSFDVHEEIFEF